MEKTIEERAKEAQIKIPLSSSPYVIFRKGYELGAAEQKAIYEEQIKELESIIELTASVMGIGTKWFSDVARMNAVRELRGKILKYYE